MDTVTLKAERRYHHGRKSCRRIREQGRLPAIIYGHGETPESITLNAHDFVMAIGHGARTMTLDLGGKQSPYLIKEVQYDYLGSKPIHVDFVRVDLTEKVRVKVGIELRGVPIGVGHGGILDQPLVEVEVECLAMNIPDTFHPVVKDLEVGQSLYVRDLVLPEGVRVLNDPDEVIAAVRVLQEKATVEPVAEPGAEPQQPERIGRVRPEEPAEDADKKS